MKQKRNGNSKQLTMVLLNNKALLILIVLVIVAIVMTDGLFFSYKNLSSVARQIAVSAMLGLGFTVLLASGSIDLSVGNMLSFLGVVYAIFTLHMPLPIAIVGALIVGAFCGLANGSISIGLGLPPFIVTLAMSQAYKGFAYLLTNGKSITGMSAAVKYIGQGLLFGFLPISIVIALCSCGILAVLMYSTKFGRYTIATGGNEEAAKVCGINTRFIRIAGFVVLGICAAIGGIILTGRVSIAAPGAGDGMEMDAIAAVVIGGTAMNGGKAKVGGTIFGCLVMGVMSNLLNLLNISSFWQWVAKCVIIILAILLDSWTEKVFKNAMKK